MSVPANDSPDPTLLDLFRAEVDQHLPTLSNGLIALETGQAEPRQIDSLMRSAHSIKGAARIIRNEPVVRLAHAIEDCLTAARDGTCALGGASIDILLQGVDTLGRMCGLESTTELDRQELETMLGRLAAVRDGTADGAARQTKAGRSLAGDHDQASAVRPKSDLQTVVITSIGEPESLNSLRVRLCEALVSAPQVLRLDFSGVDRAGAELLALLVSFARELATSHPAPARIEAVGVTPAMRCLLHVTGLDSLFRFPD